MPWSGGNYSRTDGTRNGSTVWTQAKAAGVKIVSSDHDVHDQDLADGIDACLNKDGSNAATDDLDLGDHKLTNLASGSAATDALAVGQALAVTAGGTANAITATLSPVPAAYVTGLPYSFTAAAANTGATTLNLNSLGAKNLYKPGASGPTALTGGEIQTGQVVDATYDGTQFVMTSPVAGAGATQADMEAGTAGKVVTADVIKYAPGTVKVAKKITASGGVYTLNSAGFGVASVTKNATGKITLTFSTAFSSADYIPTISIQGVAAFPVIVAVTTTTIQVEFFDITGALVDVGAAFVQIIGDF